MMTTTSHDPAHTPRERIVYTAVQHLRQYGAEGMGLRRVVADAEAPWGSLQHYFPNGKDQIVTEALVWAGEFAASVVEGYVTTALRPTPRGLLHVVIAWWVEDLQRRDFSRGCPIVGAVTDASGRDTVCDAANAALDAWAAPIRTGLVSMGRSTTDASELAVLLLATLEGAILMARAQRSTEPLLVVERRLRPLFSAD